jgi:hypothetical protein
MPRSSNPNRRRFLQILAAAPFAPWREIAEELAKPIRTYSIPEAERQIQALELETFNKAIPDLVYRGTSLYDWAKGRGEIFSRPSVFRVPVRLTPIHLYAGGTIEVE